MATLMELEVEDTATLIQTVGMGTVMIITDMGTVMIITDTHRTPLAI
jgi:hypothetical protein